MTTVGMRVVGRNLAAASLAAMMASSPALAVTKYSLVDLGTLGGINSEANGLNNSGVVVGGSITPGSGATFPFLSQPNPAGTGALMPLGTLTGATDGCCAFSSAYGVDSFGRVVGVAGIGVGDDSHAFITPPHTTGPGELIDLGTLGGGYSTAFAISSSGLVVGAATTSENVPGSGVGTHAFISSPYPTGPGFLFDLGVLEGGVASFALGINSHGQVVGSGDSFQPGDGSPDVHAFISVPNPTGPGQLIDLGTLVGPKGSALAYGINDGGRVVGIAASSDSWGHAFISQPNPTGPGELIDLGTLAGNGSSALAINSSSVVVGQSGMADGFFHAFVSLPAPTGPGQIFDLNTLLIENTTGLLLTDAVAINERGQIAGWGYFAGGVRHAFLANPVPLPSPVWLLITASFPVAWWRTTKKVGALV